MSEDTAVASRESKDDAKTEAEFVRLWVETIDLADKEEKTWRAAGDVAWTIFKGREKGSKGAAFNILHANTETLLPTLYNSTPAPDVRRRHNDKSPVAKEVADLIERCISYSVDSYDFDTRMEAVTQDMAVPGRGVTRVRYIPYLNEDESEKTYEEVACEHVPWKDFRRGPCKVWDDCPWIAFPLFLTRDDLRGLNKDLADSVNLDCTVEGYEDKKDGRNIPEVFKRAKVWEIWDKEAREVIFIAESYKDKPLKREDDPLKLAGFFPIPRPLRFIEMSDDQVPLVPYDVYREQAEELEKISKRINALIEMLKARGAYDGRMAEIGRIVNAEDGDLVAVENTAVYAEHGIEKGIMWWPIDQIAAVVEKLYVQREQIKQTIYEITGLSDILRGQSDPDETLGAQEIKTQYGSLRVQRKQSAIQRYVRELFRLKAEIIATKFSWETITMMAGLQYPSMADKQAAQQQAAQAQQAQQPIPPELEEVLSKPSREEVEKLLRSDPLRGFSIDVESDSTVRADTTRRTNEMNLFLQGTAQYVAAMAPVIQMDRKMMQPALEVFTAFARNFKLGKQAEDALDALADQARKTAESQQEDPPSPEEMKAQAIEQKAKLDGEAQQMKMQMEQQKAQMALQAQQQKHQMEMEKMQADLAMQREEMQIMREKLGMEMQAKREEMALDAEANQMQASIDQQAMERKAALDEHSASLQAESIEHKHKTGMEMMDAKAKQAKAPKPKAGKK